MLKVTYAQNPLWEKYGFCHAPLRQLFGLAEYGLSLRPGHPDRALVDEYYDCIEYCHDQVCWYLEKHPDYPYRTPGHMYFDVVALVAKEKSDRACEILRYIPRMVEKRQTKFIKDFYAILP